ncbi:MAG: DNA repair protein RadC [Dehalococcoidia bacterium]|nr:DNA repair protein RadC [Dehalococcoidia bacterium]MDH4367615.1 DNA repair protein RadC [Dehalococcoidia bacterium]
MKDSFTVRDLPLSERPRERLLKLGSEAVSAQEILAIILGRGIKGESVMAISQKLLSRFGNLKDIVNASVEELTQTKGIGPAKAAQIKAALELSRRLEGDASEKPKPVLKCPDDVAAQVRSKLKGKKKEHFFVLCLDTRNRLINSRLVSMGSLDASIVHPREVFKEAVSSCAAGVIFAHNHPSGDPEPSKEDIELTKRLARAGEIMGIDVLDHIIVCDKGHSSLKAKNLF